MININDFLPKATPVIMPVRNSLELTKRAVESVLAQDVPVSLRVIDNCSSDGTMDYLQSMIPDVMSWHFCPGLGVSASWNFGLVNAFRHADHALVINNDIELRPDTLRELLNSGFLFATGVGVSEIGAHTREFVKSIRPHPDFSCFLISKLCWEAVGPFDESMKLYASDADYHVRMQQANIYACTIGIPFYHYASGTLKQATAIDRRLIQEQADRDRETFQRKWCVKIGSPEYYAKFA